MTVINCSFTKKLSLWTKKQEYEYKYIVKFACQMVNHETINIADILNDYAKQGYRVIHIAYDEHSNRYSCVLERKIIKV